MEVIAYTEVSVAVKRSTNNVVSMTKFVNVSGVCRVLRVVFRFISSRMSHFIVCIKFDF